MFDNGEGFNLKRVVPKIWHLTFCNRYDLNIHFFRFQQYYESPDVYCKNIQFVDLMELYQKRFATDTFTYMNDWAGFNIPASQILGLYEGGLKDPNRLDMLMYSIATFIKAKENSSDFYIIGTSLDDDDYEDTFKHEFAHGLYYINEDYKNTMNQLVADIKPSDKSKIFKILKNWGYAEKVLEDETQAYLSTGLQDELNIPEIAKYEKEFIKVYNKYSRLLKNKNKNSKQINQKERGKNQVKKAAKKAVKNLKY